MYQETSGAHPRSRGENLLVDVPLRADRGSSPLTRGKHPQQIPPVARAGLIPAHAGKTVMGHANIVSPTAHPRSRGENVMMTSAIGVNPGSSPLTRGKRTVTIYARGDLGSSPLTRGKPRPPSPRRPRPWLIPAHAGKTGASVSRALLGWAHPRSRGENFVAAMYGLGLRGSSPLTRGKRQRRRHPRARRGLIPAHAGKTEMGGIEPPAGWAHPRSRGENLASQ